MGWRVRVKTQSGSQRDEHTLFFESKEEAEAALNETQGVMGTIGQSPVKIAGQLVVIGSQIVSADMYESDY
jgi:hypothetical protein